MVSDARPLGKVEVLVAEGGNGPASGLGERLADLGCFVLPAAVSAADALALLDTFRPDAVLLGARLPGGPAVVAAALDAADVPFALVTVLGGHEPNDPVLRAAPRLGRLSGRAELRRVLLRLTGQHPQRLP